MDILHVLTLSLVQGLTEFLPVSSSAHLILFPKLMGWKDHGLALAVAVHFGTLLAVLLYFREDVKQMARGSLNLLRGRIDKGGFLALRLSLATVPAVLAGFLLSKAHEEGVRSLVVIGGASIVFGVLLYLADQRRRPCRSLEAVSYHKAFWIGMMQICAFIPGASRSGSCLIALRALGLQRTEAVRFSCLLSVPVILAATSLMSYKLFWAGNFQRYYDFILAVMFSFVAGLLSISFMMRWVEKANFSIFVIYRLLLGTALLSWAYFA